MIIYLKIIMVICIFIYIYLYVPPQLSMITVERLVFLTGIIEFVKTYYLFLRTLIANCLLYLL